MSADALQDKIEELANSLADKQLCGDAVDEQALDVIKTLSSWFGISRRLGRKKGDDDDSQGFGAVKDAIARASGGMNGTQRQ